MSYLAKKSVDKLIKSYKTNNPFQIADAKNIFVFERNLHEEILGFYKYIRKNKFIYINSNLDYYMKYFVCAHELGHSQLHSRVNTPFLKKNTLFSTNKIEVEANEFAVNLLLYNKNLEDYETKYDVLRENGIPYEMERFI